MQLKKYKFLPAITWFIVITILFCLPGSAIPPAGFLEDIHFDKFVHFVLFFVLVIFLQKPFIYSDKHNVLLLFFGITLLSIHYGVAIEFIQENWIPNRSFDPGDIIADAVGTLTAYGWGLQKRSRYKKR